jgi:hypothetical protein
MFKRLVMLVRGLMGSQSTAPSSLTAEQPSPSAKPLRAKRTPVSPQVVRQPVKSKPKLKSKAVQPTSQVKSRKAAPKLAQTTTGNRGQSSKALAPQTQSPAPTKRKSTQEAAPSTTAVRKPGKKKPTVRQVAMVSQSKPTGSKSKTPASKTRQPASQAQTVKQKAVDSTLADKKAIQDKTSAPILMGRPYKITGY